MIMNKIPSFTVNHLILDPGVYVSRIDQLDQHYITTYDLRMKKPNAEPVINTGELHTLEHLGATFLRNHPQFKEEVIYFGPMGCRTGYYLILKGERSSNEIVPLLIDLYQFMADFDGEVPGASAKDCGNYHDMNLPMARYEAKAYLHVLKHITSKQLSYQE